MTRQNAGNANQAKVMMAETKQIVEKVDTHMNRMAGGDRGDHQDQRGDRKDHQDHRRDRLPDEPPGPERRCRGGPGRRGRGRVRRGCRRGPEPGLKGGGGGPEHQRPHRKHAQGRPAGQRAHVGHPGGLPGERANAGKVAQLIDEIATASQEQAQGIDQLNRAVSEMDRVTQQTAANAEETASVSIGLTSQAEQMRQYIDDLSAVIVGKRRP